MKLFKNSKGFTLIELLIVIAVIGILAIALMAAIDPIEQLKKSRDAGRLADSKELLSAYQRFYTSKQCMPQQYSATGCASTSPLVAAVVANTGSIAADMTEMSTEGELKTTFPTKAGLDKIYAGIDANATPVVCFEPESKGMRLLPLGQRYTLAAATSTITAATVACPAAYNGAAVVASCMICVQ